MTDNIASLLLIWQHTSQKYQTTATVLLRQRIHSIRPCLQEPSNIANSRSDTFHRRSSPSDQSPSHHTQVRPSTTFDEQQRRPTIFNPTLTSPCLPDFAPCPCRIITTVSIHPQLRSYPTSTHCPRHRAPRFPHCLTLRIPLRGSHPTSRRSARPSTSNHFHLTGPVFT